MRARKLAGLVCLTSLLLQPAIAQEKIDKASIPTPRYRFSSGQKFSVVELRSTVVKGVFPTDKNMATTVTEETHSIATILSALPDGRFKLSMESLRVVISLESSLGGEVDDSWTIDTDRPDDVPVPEMKRQVQQLASSIGHKYELTLHPDGRVQDFRVVVRKKPGSDLTPSILFVFPKTTSLKPGDSWTDADGAKPNPIVSHWTFRDLKTLDGVKALRLSGNLRTEEPNRDTTPPTVETEAHLDNKLFVPIRLSSTTTKSIDKFGTIKLRQGRHTVRSVISWKQIHSK